MQIYLVLSEADRPDLGERVRSVYGENSRRVAPGQWLVAANDTPQGVSNRLDVSDGAFGRVMVANVAQYWGWHDKEMWSWINLKGAA